MSIDVRPIELPRDAAAFVKAWWPIYEGDPHWVPPLIFERKQFLNPRLNPYFKVADVQCFLAWRDGRPAGTIAATWDYELQKTEPGVGMFGFFEFPDDEKVARPLLDEAMAWLRQRGAKKAWGPFNFNPNHDFGLLVDGFDTDPMVANPHNRPYYEGMYRRLGMHKVRDWFAYWMDRGPVPEKVNAIARRFMDRNSNVKLRPFDKSKFESELRLFRDIYNDAFVHNWGHVYLTDAEFQWVGKNFKRLLDPRLSSFVYVDGECAGAMVTVPDFNQVVKRCNGRLFPFGWWHLLTGSRNIDAVRVFVLGVKSKYQHLPVGAPLYVRTWDEALKMGVRGAEASLILDENYRVRGALEKVGARIYKTYRIYEAEA
jgi:hypothetical protein